MKIYHYHPVTGEFLNESIAPVDPAETQRRYHETGEERLMFLISADATETAPPEAGDDETAVFDGKFWQVLQDHRGKTAYNTISRQGVTISQFGPVPDGFTLVPPSSPFDTWSNGKWKTDNSQLLAEEKTRMLEQANTFAEDALTAILDTYPTSERLSWDKQEQEARAYMADKSAETPLLSVIASERGITRQVLVAKVMAKSAAFTALSGRVFGLRQKYESRIQAATTLTELREIQLAY